MIEADFRALQATALQFAQAIAQRDYALAYTLTSYSYQQQTSVADIQEVCERMLPADWGAVSTIILDDVLEAWPDKQPDDLGWIYVSE